jgi:predicted ribosome quality control (RQC) complex YloA/Tae2 family protein
VKAYVEEAFVSAHLCVFKARITGETLWVLLGSGPPSSGVQGVGVLGHEAKKQHFSGRAPPGHVRIPARSRLFEGGTLTRLGQRSVMVETAEGTHLAVLRGGNVGVLTNEAPLDAEVSLEDARALGPALSSAVADAAVSIFRAEILAALKKAISRVERRVAAVEKDLLAMAKADDMLLSAQWLLPLAGGQKRGQTELVATDWAQDPPRQLRIALDPARSAKEQIDGMFKRARRLKAGRAVAEPRRTQAVAQRDGLSALAARAKEETTLPLLQAVVEEARAAAPKDFALATAAEGSAARKAEERERGHRTYAGEGGARILVGRTSQENDALTFKLARPHDLWLHAKGRKGAHVIVPRDKHQEVPPGLLVDAAHLAAHFSEGRDEAVVDVEYTQRKFLKKPKGGAPGLAIVEREKVIAVRIEKARLASLLGEAT